MNFKDYLETKVKKPIDMIKNGEIDKNGKQVIEAPEEEEIKKPKEKKK